MSHSAPIVPSAPPEDRTAGDGNGQASGQGGDRVEGLRAATDELLEAAEDAVIHSEWNGPRIRRLAQATEAYRRALPGGDPSGTERVVSAGLAPGVPPVGSPAGRVTPLEALDALVLAIAVYRSGRDPFGLAVRRLEDAMAQAVVILGLPAGGVGAPRRDAPVAMSDEATTRSQASADRGPSGAPTRPDAGSTPPDASGRFIDREIEPADLDDLRRA